MNIDRQRELLLASRYVGVPAVQAADAAGVGVEVLKAARFNHGRDPEDGQPRVHRIPKAGRTLDHDDFDRLMRSNRSLCG